MTGFDRAISVMHAHDIAVAELDPAYMALRGILGGYLAAVTVRAVEPHLDGRQVRTVATTFLRPGRAGRAELVVRTLRAGRSVATFDVTLRQDDKPVVSTRITAVGETSGPEWDHGTRPAVAPLIECVPFTPPEGVIHFRQATTVLDPASLPFTHQDHVVLGGYMRPLETRPIDAPWLTAALDWFPPSPFVRLDPPTGGVSVDYVVHVHATLAAPLADHAWLSADFRTEVSSDGLALEHGRIADPQGRLLAESFHTRWTG